MRHQLLKDIDLELKAYKNVLEDILFYLTDVQEETFPRWVWERGAVFYHNVDKDGKKLCKNIVLGTAFFFFFHDVLEI